MSRPSPAYAARRAAPVRRTAALGAAAALAVGAAAFAPAAFLPAAQAAPAPAAAFTGGAATATVLRADLDVSVLNRTVDVPVHASLNDVSAPGDARATALTVTVGHGVQAGGPVDLLRATAATANATVDGATAEGYSSVVDARVHLPGLPLLSLVSLDAATSRAICRAGRAPTASSHLVGLSVLGRRVALNAVGTTTVDVPGVGRVDLALTHKVVTSATAAATAVHLSVHVDPLSLGVTGVSGDVTIARAGCRTPQSGGGAAGGSTNGGSAAGSTGGGSANGGGANGGSSGGSTNGSAGSGGSTTGGTGSSGSTGSTASGGSASGGSSGGSSGGASSGTDARTQTVGGGNLAETGASSSMPYVAAGAVALVLAGGGAVVPAARRRRGGDADA